MTRLGILSGLKRAPAAAAQQVLRFPSNFVESPRILLTGSSLHSFSPATYIWEITPAQQSGYYTTFFHGDNTVVTGGVYNPAYRYFGCHPYPDGGVIGENYPTTHKWEISAHTADYVTDDNANSTVVVKGVKYLQAAVVSSSGGNYTIKFYWNLPSTSKVITFPDFPTADTSNPPNPCFVIGGAPWSTAFENLSGDFGRLKIIAAALSQADVLSESGNLASLQTSSGIANIWFGKTNWRSLTDLTCDYGTGHAFAWADSANKATLAAAA